MVDAGLLAAADAAFHPDASILDRAIGALPDVKADISGWISLHEGDRILLCSDGLHGYVLDSEITGVLEYKASAQELTDRLVDLALQKGGEDNITVQLLEYGPSRKRAWSKMVQCLASKKMKKTTKAAGMQTSTSFPLPVLSSAIALIPRTAANGL
jgi:protein phosphatase